MFPAWLVALLDLLRQPGVLWFGAAVLLLVILFYIFYDWPEPPGYGYKPLLTANEKEFMGRLEQALPEFQVLCQVAMGALLQPVNIRTKQQFFAVRGTFAQKICDFVLLDKERREVLAIIELDDKTHDPKKDARRDAMLHQAGYLTLRFESRDKPTQAKLRQIVLTALDAG